VDYADDTDKFFNKALDLFIRIHPSLPGRKDLDLSASIRVYSRLKTKT